MDLIIELQVMDFIIGLLNNSVELRLNIGIKLKIIFSLTIKSIFIILKMY